MNEEKLIFVAYLNGHCLRIESINDEIVYVNVTWNKDS